jgi:hypothetical protein
MHFTRSSTTNERIAHKLKNLVRRYIDSNFQRHTHDSSTDALMTLRLFIEIYVKLDIDLHSKGVQQLYNEIVNYDD